MYMKLDEDVVALLCCPLCKSDLLRHNDGFTCAACGLWFPLTTVRTHGNTTEAVFDFRVLRPPYCVPAGLAAWGHGQEAFEEHQAARVESDSVEEYRDEIHSVKEIYSDEFHLNGRVLDVGGHQGRLRHYLGTDVDLYVSVDPYVDVFRDIGSQHGLLEAYPCLSRPCNFIACSAEELPFKSGTFDWIHMRSVVDHFADPYVAFLEAYRCAAPGGKLLVGLSILEMLRGSPAASEAGSSRIARLGHFPVQVVRKLRRDGVQGLFRAASERMSRAAASSHEDDHMFCLTADSLDDLFAATGWDVFKRHWQKPPHDHCIYMAGVKECSAHGRTHELANLTRQSARDVNSASLGSL